jgi:protein-S-isoprenylcysteine O-methyltransferase Ste14
MHNLIALLFAAALMDRHVTPSPPSKWFRVLVLTLSVLATAGGFYFCWVGEENWIRMTGAVVATLFFATFIWQARKLARED